MRALAWVFVVCTTLGIVGVFLPSVRVESAGGHTLGKRASMSLYQMEQSRTLVREVIAKYHAHGSRVLGEKAGAAVMAHVHGAVHEGLDDALSAMDSLDDVTDDQAREGSQLFVVVIWAFMILNGLMALLVLPEIVNDTYRRARVMTALAGSLLAAPIAIGTLVMTRALVWEANDEIGAHVFGTAPGAYATPIAGCLALLAAISLVMLRARANPPGTT